MRCDSAKEFVKVWRPSVLPDVELLRATYVTQTFARHAHEGFAVGVIEEGALGFYYRGENVTAARGAINLANPDEVHTGHAAVREGWTYRMFYLDAEVLRKAASQIAGRRVHMPFFRAGVIQDDSLAGMIRNLHIGLESNRCSTIEKESRFLQMVSLLIGRHADDPPVPHRIGRERRAVSKTRDYIDCHFGEELSIRQLASLARLSPFHFIRVFAAGMGIPPHAYMNQVRVRRARELLSGGWPVAQTACETGFVDQSHLTRHFKRILGITPGQYRNFVQDGRKLQE